MDETIPGSGIDSSPPQAESRSVKRWLPLLMLLGALLGLLGQEAAFAHMMPVEKAGQGVVTAQQMSPECAEMMGLATQQPESGKPCEGMTPDCIAKMGCAVPLALPPPLMAAMPMEFRASTPSPTSVARLVGRDTGPEPHPPARLG